MNGKRIEFEERREKNERCGGNIYL